MRTINLSEVTEKVKNAVIEINYKLDDSLVALFNKAYKNETKDSIIDAYYMHPQNLTARKY